MSMRTMARWNTGLWAPCPPAATSAARNLDDRNAEACGQRLAIAKLNADAGCVRPVQNCLAMKPNERHSAGRQIRSRQGRSPPLQHALLVTSFRFGKKFRPLAWLKDWRRLQSPAAARPAPARYKADTRSDPDRPMPRHRFGQAPCRRHRRRCRSSGRWRWRYAFDLVWIHERTCYTSAPTRRCMSAYKSDFLHVLAEPGLIHSFRARDARRARMH